MCVCVFQVSGLHGGLCSTLKPRVSVVPSCERVVPAALALVAPAIVAIRRHETGSSVHSGGFFFGVFFSFSRLKRV